MINEKSFKQTPETIVKNTPQISNKYKDVSLSDLAKILNNIDTKQKDKDLEFVMDLLIDLIESIQICKQFKLGKNSNGFAKSMYQTHFTRIKYITEALDQFAWFSQLKTKDERLNYSDEKINNQ